MSQVMELERKLAIERARQARVERARPPLWLIGLAATALALILVALLLMVQ
ncbi:MAG TPA: hypothetical protein VGA52_03780 [Anaerolineales bacterium]|jgi:hypothetical protein